MSNYSLFLEMLAKPWTKIHVSQYCANLFNKFHQIFVGGCETTSYTKKERILLVFSGWKGQKCPSFHCVWKLLPV